MMLYFFVSLIILIYSSLKKTIFVHCLCSISHWFQCARSLSFLMVRYNLFRLQRLLMN